ncbi:MAG: DUF2059 domain-containing protein [Acidobacteria bacterium]|nr:DUF2059 domain-containing protein [Acidobacteriota bacterium]
MRRALILASLPVLLAAQAPAPNPAPNAAPTPGDAEAAAKRADIRTLLDAMHAGELGVQAIQKMVGTMKATNTQLPAEFWDEFLKAATAEKLTEVAIPAYEQNLTHAEVKAYLAFIATPEGASIMKKLPLIQDEAMKAGQAWGQQMGLEIAQKLHAEGKL